MDNLTDDHNMGIDPADSPGELEEALKWLEELTARQSKPAELSNPVPAVLDSPFRGLIDSEDGDLPDWLREVRIPSGDREVDESEPESRLDWLAKMAQRESIEELPTLEWRRLPEPVQSAILADSKKEPLPPADDLVPSEIGSVATVPEEQITGDEITPTQKIAGDTADLPLIESLPAEPTADFEQATTTISVDPIAGVTTIDIASTSGSDTGDDTAPVTDDFSPPIDDLDAAMAWIEELAVSQDTPIEDLPSVADRALASKLMAEAGLSPLFSPLDEFGSDPSLLDSLTPTHPFIQEEDFADTIVLVETLAADQSADTSHDTAPVSHDDLESDYLGQITTYDDTLTEPSFEEAMAFLDELALTDPEEPSTHLISDDIGPIPAADIVAAAVETITIDQSEASPAGIIHEPDELIAAESSTLAASEFKGITGSEIDIPPADDFTPWVDHGYESLSQEAGDIPAHTISSSLPGKVASNGINHSDLESALLRLDSLALPPGKSVSEIDTTIQTTRMAAPRDVNTALDWLEAALAGRQTPVAAPLLDLEEEDIIDLMPEDPDEVLAWLESLSGEESAVVSDIPTYEQPTMAMIGAIRSEPPVEELAEADLLNMPEDPDEAMAWLESLAREGARDVDVSPEVNREPVTAYLPDIPPSPYPSDVILAADEPEVADSLLESSPEAVIEHIDEAPIYEPLDAVSAEIDIESAELPDFESVDLITAEEETEQLESIIHKQLDAETETESVELSAFEPIDLVETAVDVEQAELPAGSEGIADLVETIGNTAVTDDVIVEVGAAAEAASPEPLAVDPPIGETPAKPTRRRRKQPAPKAIAEATERKETIQEPESSPPSQAEETVELTWIDLLKPLQ